MAKVREYVGETTIAGTLADEAIVRRIAGALESPEALPYMRPLVKRAWPTIRSWGLLPILAARAAAAWKVANRCG